MGGSYVTNAIEGHAIEKAFAKKRALKELVRRPFQRAERVQALRGVDLEIRQGEIFGLLGPNGAGKTTLLKILACLVLPDAGSARIAGHDILDEDRVKPCIGLVHSDERSFYWRLSGRENLQFFATLYNVPRAKAPARIEELLRRVDMLDAADRRFADYSSGMKQRLAIARALLHDPPILLMDEPTRSLDPASAMNLRSFIADKLKKEGGKTILLATHNLREAEVLCDRVAVLVKGQVRRLGSVDEVRRADETGRHFRIETAHWPAALAGPFRVVSDEPWNGARRITVALLDGGRLNDVLRAVLSAGGVIDGCEPLESDLEEAFSRILAAAEEPAA